jgi:hypothetical protein
MRRKLIGTIIGIVFGLVWGVVGACPLPPEWRLNALIAIVLIAAALIIAAVRTSGSTNVLGSKPFDGRAYGGAVAAEALAIVVAVPLLTHAHREAYVPPVIALIVGLHFLGLWKASGQRMFVWICVGLCAVSCAAALVPIGVVVEGTGVQSRLAFTGLGSALALWIACAVSMLWPARSR